MMGKNSALSGFCQVIVCIAYDHRMLVAGVLRGGSVSPSLNVSIAQLAP
jgi:hypothetical protein